jgi:hypothetical protein
VNKTIVATRTPPITSKSIALLGLIYLVVILGIKLQNPHRTNAPKVGNSQCFIEVSLFIINTESPVLSKII